MCTHGKVCACVCACACAGTSHLGDALRESAGRDRLVRVRRAWVHRGHHDGLAVAAERVAEHGGEERVAVGDVLPPLLLALLQSHDDHSEVVQRRVDAQGLAERAAARACNHTACQRV